jgi:hypothetical protein
LVLLIISVAQIPLILCKLSGGADVTKGYWTLVMENTGTVGTSGLRD